MTRELDIEIARLDGWTRHVDDDTLEVVWYDGWGNDLADIPHYSTSLDALMELIRRRWPIAAVHLYLGAASLWVPVGDWGLTTFNEESSTREFVHRGGDTDAERLAHAVKQALEAERE